MHKTFINFNGTSHLMTLISFLIFIFFLSHIFFGERSVWKIFELKSQISKSQEKYELKKKKKKKILLQINLLRDNNLDSDLVFEIFHRKIAKFGLKNRREIEKTNTSIHFSFSQKR